MKILIIGHEGYLGAGLFRAFSRQDHEVLGWSRAQDIASLERDYLIKNQIQAVINCAAVQDRVSSRYLVGSPSDAVNVAGVRHLVEVLRDLPIKLIHFSSKDVYGTPYRLEDLSEEDDRYVPKHLISDCQPFAPETVYAKTKLISEFLVETLELATVVRLSSCYTDFDHYRGHWVIAMIKAMQAGKPVTVTKNGKQFRDLLHVDDLGRLVQIILEGRHGGVKVNAGGGLENTVSLLEFVKLVNPRTQVLYNPEGGDYGFAFKNDLAWERFRWRPEISFHERLPLLLKNIAERRIS
ncbi:MAG: NAD-dependent epimerase/dehydratase family protein [Bdellovibrionota bacterium]